MGDYDETLKQAGREHWGMEDGLPSPGHRHAPRSAGTGPARARSPQKQLRFIPFHDLKIGALSSTYLVKRLLPRTGLAVVWGPPKCGKSFWVFDLMLHVALGWEYRGQRVQPGSVVYCAMEGAEGFNARAEAFRRRFFHDRDDAADSVPLMLMPTPMTLVADHTTLVNGVRKLFFEDFEQPAAVVIDTLNRSLAGSESKDEDMAAYVRAADAIRDAFDCLVIIVHHSGIDASRPRGHTSLTGAADAQIAVKRDAAGNVVATVEFMKDGPEGDVYASRLESVDLGADEDGDPITSCVIVPVLCENKHPETTGLKISDRHKLAMRALSEAVIDSGQPASAMFQLPAGIRVVPTERWRDELFRSGVLDKAGKNPRQDFRRIREALAARSMIGERDGMVWSAVRVDA